VEITEDMKIYAEFLGENGYEHDVPDAKEAGLVVGNFYEIETVIVGQSHSVVYLKDYKKSFNTVMFDFAALLDHEFFVDVDIFSSPLFNPYIGDV